ncbi:MAG: hypothetical protein U0790_01650 [Isosphaeraceae bacterium]
MIRRLCLLLVTGLLTVPGCGDPQAGSISKPKEAASIDPAQPVGLPEPTAPKRPAKNQTPQNDDQIKNPKLKG